MNSFFNPITDATPANKGYATHPIPSKLCCTCAIASRSRIPFFRKDGLFHAPSLPHQIPYNFPWQHTNRLLAEKEYPPPDVKSDARHAFPDNGTVQHPSDTILPAYMDKAPPHHVHYAIRETWTALSSGNGQNGPRLSLLLSKQEQIIRYLLLYHRCPNIVSQDNRAASLSGKHAK